MCFKITNGYLVCWCVLVIAFSCLALVKRICAYHLELVLYLEQLRVRGLVLIVQRHAAVPG